MLGGIMKPVEGSDHSYSWQMDFRYGFCAYGAWSVSWLNEGHVPGHHRDGFVSQIWGRLPLADGKWELNAGVGFDRYYDTQEAPNGDSLDVHGFAPIYSLSATYYTDSPWFVRLTANHIAPSSNIDVNTVVIGVGYGLGKADKNAGTVVDNTKRTTDNEFTVFIGKSVVNTFFSESAVASGVEYRRGIGKNLDWTLSYIYEGDPEIIRRNGLGTQVWLVGSYLDDRLTLGIGFGIYVYIDRKNLEDPTGQDLNSDLAGLISPTISYRFSDKWLVRFNWNRVVTNYNRDADVFLLGVGYRWR